MATKKTSAKVTVHKVISPKKVVVKFPKYELISFEMGATIPTQMYGNILPRIVVKAKTIEDAKAVVVPFMEELYAAYASEGPDGKTAKFINKANVTATERIVDPVPAPVAPKPAPAPAPVIPKPLATPVRPASTQTPAESAQSLADELNPKSAAYEKAYGAIKNSMSAEALELIEGQIQKSVKLSDEEKPILLTEVLKKRKDFEI